MATVELRNIIKRYQKQRVIHGVNLSIKKGQFAVIVGPSGCGKSTLLRMIAGLEEISYGEVLVNDQVINDLPPKDRDIAMVFQNYALYPHMTVFNNIAYGLRMRGTSAKQIRKKVNEVAEKLQLSELLRRKPGKLSGGQRQRVAMGRAIVREPTLFLFDEPLSNLDTQLRVEMRLEIYRLQRELKITSIYVTHDQVEAMTLADKLIVMNEGRIEQVGPPLEIYHQPATQFVASFIGSPTMNFIPAEVCDEGRAVSLLGKYILPLDGMLLNAYDGKTITVGIRPEVLKIAHQDDPDQFQIRVNVVEALGSENIVYGQMTGASQEIVAKLPGNIYTHIGEVLTLSVKTQHLHFFDVETQQRIVPL